jgi:hypothetical protein
VVEERADFEADGFIGGEERGLAAGTWEGADLQEEGGGLLV